MGNGLKGSIVQGISRARGSCIGLTGVCMKVSFTIITSTEMEFTSEQMGRNIQESGKIISWMDRGRFDIRMGRCTMDSTRTIKNKGTEYLHGQMEGSMKVNGCMGRSMVVGR